MTGLSMSSGWTPISPLPVLYPHFEIGKNPNTYSNLVKAEKILQIVFGSGRNPHILVLLSCLRYNHDYLSQHPTMLGQARELMSMV